MRIKDCKLIELTRIQDQRGNLSVVEGGRDIPFEIRRAYYLYDIPGGAVRAGHGHKKLHQLMIAMSGAFDVHARRRNGKAALPSQPIVFRPVHSSDDLARSRQLFFWRRLS